MRNSIAIRKTKSNSAAQIYTFSGLLSNKHMDIDEIRRINIRLLENEFDSPSELAEKAGMSLTQYLNLRDGAKDSKTGKPRGMRKETAWKIEDAGGKKRGWLDQDRSTLLSIPLQDITFLESVQNGISKHELPEHIRQTILTLISSSPEKK